MNKENTDASADILNNPLEFKDSQKCPNNKVIVAPAFWGLQKCNPKLKW